MLHAIISNKSGRIKIGDESISIREIYKEREDMITAAIISRIGYLSDSVLQRMLKSIFPLSDKDFTELKQIEFWPNFKSSYQTRVEPDVILHFSWGIILIEAKRPHDGFQYAEQWRNELEALPEGYKKDQIYFLALGGRKVNFDVEKARVIELISNDKGITAIQMPTFIEHIDWLELAKELNTIHQTMTLSRNDKCVICDMLAVLELYNVTTTCYPLKTLISSNLSIDNTVFDVINRWKRPQA